MKKLIGIFSLSVLLSGCSSNSVDKIKTATDNFNTNVAAINASIAVAAPAVAARCADIQKWAMLIAPFVPNSGRAQQYFGAANGAINGYCQSVPTDINSVAAATAAAAQAAQTGYYSIKAGG